MFLADCHTHSKCSPDSNAPMLQMAQKAYEYGLNTLCLTDHCDLLSLEGERVLVAVNMSEDGFDAFHDAYRGPAVDLITGAQTQLDGKLYLPALSAAFWHC